MFQTKQLTMLILKSLSRGAVTLVVALAIVFFSSQQISKISNSIQEKRTLSYILEKRTEITTTLKEGFAKVGDADKRIEDAFPPVNNILDFVSILESLAAQNSLQQSLKFGAPVPFSAEGDIKLSTIDYNLTLNGNILTLLNYLKNFERLPYFTEITSISLNSLTEVGWDGDSNITVKARVYAKE